MWYAGIDINMEVHEGGTTPILTACLFGESH